MSHDKIKAAIRQRMAATGEPYTLARRAIMLEQEYKAQREKAYKRVATQLADHGREVRSQITSASGIDEIQRRFAALQWFRNLGHSVDGSSTEFSEDGRWQQHCRRCGHGLELTGNGGWASPSGTGRCPHEGASW